MQDCLKRATSPQRVEYQWRTGPHPEDTFKVILERVPGQTADAFCDAFREHVNRWMQERPRWGGE